MRDARGSDQHEYGGDDPGEGGERRERLRERRRSVRGCGYGYGDRDRAEDGEDDVRHAERLPGVELPAGDAVPVDEQHPDPPGAEQREHPLVEADPAEVDGHRLLASRGPAGCSICVRMTPCWG